MKCLDRLSVSLTFIIDSFFEELGLEPFRQAANHVPSCHTLVSKTVYLVLSRFMYQFKINNERFAHILKQRMLLFSRCLLRNQTVQVLDWPA